MSEKPKRTRDERKADALRLILDEGRAGDDKNFLLAVLIDSIDRLKDTTERNSQTTNELTKKIKTLNWILVVISVLGLAIAAYGVFFK
jgi:hypothetical protein